MARIKITSNLISYQYLRHLTHPNKVWSIRLYIADFVIRNRYETVAVILTMIGHSVLAHKLCCLSKSWNFSVCTCIWMEPVVNLANVNRGGAQKTQYISRNTRNIFEERKFKNIFIYKNSSEFNFSYKYAINK